MCGRPKNLERYFCIFGGFSHYEMSDKCRKADQMIEYLFQKDRPLNATINNASVRIFAHSTMPKLIEFLRPKDNHPRCGLL